MYYLNKKYDKYKDSGINWIGRIPEKWEIIKFKYKFTIIGGNGFPETLQGNNSGDLPFCKCSDINGDTMYIDSAKNYISYEICSNNKFNTIPQNSILIPKIGEALKKNHRKINKVACCIDNNMEAFLFKNNKDNIHYYYYLFTCIDMLWFDNNGTIPSVNNEKLRHFKIPYINYSKQQEISDYLDKKCEKIDEVIEIEKQIIEKLKEYKQSVITEAVTKGLDKSVPMKDSGIEWIGQIPVHWKVIAHKYVMKKVKTLCDKYNNEDIISLTMRGVIKRDLENPTGKMPLTFDGYQRVYPNNLLLCLFDIDVTPRCVGVINDNGLTSPAYSQYQLANNDNVYYYNYLLRSIDDNKCFLHLSKNLRSSLKDEDFGAIHTIKPDYNEQQVIVDYLDKKCASIDKAITDKETVIEKLTEYKKSLIYECVTGKRKVA